MSTLAIFASRRANAGFYRRRGRPRQSPAATFLWHRHLACESTGWKPVPHKTAGTLRLRSLRLCSGQAGQAQTGRYVLNREPSWRPWRSAA